MLDILNIIPSGFMWNVVYGVIVVSVVIFLFGLIGASSRSQKMRQQAPAALTAIGIFGTFLGIAYALADLDFSPARMNDSVAGFLDGMKGAFWTSLIGLGASILFRAAVAFGLHRKGPSDPAHDSVLAALADIREAIAGKGDDTLATGIGDIRLKLKDGFEQQEKALQNLSQAMGGAHEGSLAGRVDKMRLDVSDRLDKLLTAQENGFTKLDALTKTIRDALGDNLKALIDELHESVGKELRKSLDRLIGEIQKALIEQFGKTFVEFNEATQALKQWQADHREQVEQLTRAFDTATGGMASIAENCQTIPATMGSLQKGVKMIQEDVTAFNHQLEAFASLREQAEQSFPTIKRNLDTIGDDLGQSAEGLRGMKDVIEDAFQKAEASAKHTMDAHASSVETMAASMVDAMKSAQQESASKVEATIEVGMRQFSVEMEQAMKRIVDEWGGNMVGIAERCREVVEAVKGRH